MHRQCPNALLIMAGYSQGAMVMHQAELQLAATSGDAGLTERITGTLLPYLNAIACPTAATCIAVGNAVGQFGQGVVATGAS